MKLKRNTQKIAAKRITSDTGAAVWQLNPSGADGRVPKYKQVVELIFF
jgi:hypothetical protein